MSVPSSEQVLQALSAIIDPDLGRDVVSLGMIKDLDITPAGAVAFNFELTTPACPVKDRFRNQAEELVSALPGVSAVNMKFTSNVRAGFFQRQGPELIPGVRNTIAIASGKGGVGKSTVAINIAAALRQTGARVGLLDADIYGPSVPAMAGVSEQPVVVEGRLVPLEAYGLKLMSIGFQAGSDKAMVWRGPMVSKAISQMIGDVSWGELDYLLIDLPPGTGDASLTIAQTIPLSGVAVVCTPQDVALDIAVKALQMFRSLNVKALGLVENMSWFVCDGCGKEHHIFSHGGGEAAAERLGVPFLGSIPLEAAVREEADAGAPVVLSRPETASAGAFRDIAGRIASQCSIQSFRQLPVINVH